MLIEIDFNSDEALYVQLQNQIIMGIATATIQEGESLPSVRQLADTVGINMHTVNKAYSILKQEGFIQLDDIHIQIFQQVQRRIACAEIVDGGADTVFVHGLHKAEQCLIAFIAGHFRQFHLNVFGETLYFFSTAKISSARFGFFRCILEKFTEMRTGSIPLDSQSWMFWQTRSNT